jgi:hypothetical protein
MVGFWEVLGGAVGAVYVLSAAMLALQAGVHIVLLRAPAPAPAPTSVPALGAGGADGADDRPEVVVQLPMYNEPAVVERLLEAVARLDWPADRLMVQILDDSTDDTPDRVARWLAAQPDRPFRWVHLRRAHRTGFKAGALQAGLEAVGDVPWVMIYDADFVPGVGDLAYAMRHVRPDTAAVQLRWDHLNAEENGLTRVQALNLDAHFAVEQRGRQGRGVWNAFNGTAGLWRVEAMRAAGGWEGDTLAEDLDLSVRVQRAGWRVEYRDDYGVPAELPADFAAYRAQQRRWTQGGAACLRKHVSTLPSVPSRRLRWHARALLAASSIHLAVWGIAVSSVGLVALAGPPASPHSPALPWIPAVLDGAAVLGALLLLLIALYKTAANRRHNWRIGEGWAWFLPRMAALWLLGAGMAWWHVRAWMAGIRGTPAEFVRTPKRGGPGAPPPPRPARSFGGWQEALHVLYFAWGAYLGLTSGHWGLVPFHLLLAAGYAWVAIGSSQPDLRWAKVWRLLATNY